MADLRALRESVELENRADLCAAGGDFMMASSLMQQANNIRRREFGSLNPNELRDRTRAALSAPSRTSPND